MKNMNKSIEDLSKLIFEGKKLEFAKAIHTILADAPAEDRKSLLVDVYTKASLIALKRAAELDVRSGGMELNTLFNVLDFPNHLGFSTEWTKDLGKFNDECAQKLMQGLIWYLTVTHELPKSKFIPNIVIKLADHCKTEFGKLEDHDRNYIEFEAIMNNFFGDNLKPDVVKLIVSNNGSIAAHQKLREEFVKTHLDHGVEVVHSSRMGNGKNTEVKELDEVFNMQANAGKHSK